MMVDGGFITVYCFYQQNPAADPASPPARRRSRYLNKIEALSGGAKSSTTLYILAAR